MNVNRKFEAGFLLLALAERNLFTTHTDLINMTGVHAESSVRKGQRRRTEHLGPHDWKSSCKILIYKE